MQPCELLRYCSTAKLGHASMCALDVPENPTHLRIMVSDSSGRINTKVGAFFRRIMTHFLTKEAAILAARLAIRILTMITKSVNVAHAMPMHRRQKYVRIAREADRPT